MCRNLPRSNYLIWVSPMRRNLTYSANQSARVGIGPYRIRLRPYFVRHIRHTGVPYPYPYRDAGGSYDTSTNSSTSSAIFLGTSPAGEDCARRGLVSKILGDTATAPPYANWPELQLSQLYFTAPLLGPQRTMHQNAIRYGTAAVPYGPYTRTVRYGADPYARVPGQFNPKEAMTVFVRSYTHIHLRPTPHSATGLPVAIELSTSTALHSYVHYPANTDRHYVVAGVTCPSAMYWEPPLSLLYAAALCSAARVDFLSCLFLRSSQLQLNPEAQKKTKRAEPDLWTLASSGHLSSESTA
ncbi:hypothetical protein GGX14DRAFT_387652 [Mycena pura]|uniref:Uncharacterized protein n=1 Tax=Mycena pura TaxID=153505 RepID=A0AAD7E151_9AGAR|nr:hypothetical protein GGX14DRAFT_387652 [Mycena pura]